MLAKDAARKQKRKPTHYSNIYVVKDPANPANEGKVMLFKYGVRRSLTNSLLCNLSSKMRKPIDPFDFWQGANFKLKAKNVAGYRNYDSSEFAAQSALLDDDDAMELHLEEAILLAEIVASDQFKDYDALKKRLDYVLGNKALLASKTKSSSKRKKSSAATVELLFHSPKEELDALSSSSGGFNDPDITPSSNDDDDVHFLIFLPNWAEWTVVTST